MRAVTLSETDPHLTAQGLETSGYTLEIAVYIKFKTSYLIFIQVSV